MISFLFGGIRDFCIITLEICESFVVGFWLFELFANLCVGIPCVNVHTGISMFGHVLF